MVFNKWSALLTVLLIAGCNSSTNDVVKPSEVTVDAALTSVMKAFVNVQNQEPPGFRMGVSVCSITTSLNLTTGENIKDGLVVDVGVKGGGGPISGGIDLTGSHSVEAVANRSNNMVVTLTSEACLPAGTAGTAIATGIYGTKPADESAKNKGADTKTKTAEGDLKQKSKVAEGAVGGKTADPTIVPVEFPQPTLDEIFTQHTQNSAQFVLIQDKDNPQIFYPRELFGRFVQDKTAKLIIKNPPVLKSDGTYEPPTYSVIVDQGWPVIYAAAMAQEMAP